MQKLTLSRKRKRVGSLLLKICDSLVSHVDWIDTKEGAFHRKTIKEYAAAIKDAADLL